MADSDKKEQLDDPVYADISPTDEELALAESELKHMKPADMLEMQRYIESLERNLPEAGGIAFGTLETVGGAHVHITARGPDLKSALIDFINGVSWAHGQYQTRLIADNEQPSRPARTPAQPPSTNTPPPSSGAPAAPPATTGAPPPPATAAPPTEHAPAAPSGVVETGTDILNRIIHVPGKSIEFHVGKFRYPFTDARINHEGGAATIAGLFDSSLGWKPEHFGSAPAVYESNEFGTLHVDWEKVKKGGKTYYNVKRIHA